MWNFNRRSSGLYLTSLRWSDSSACVSRVCYIDLVPVGNTQAHKLDISNEPTRLNLQHWFDGRFTVVSVNSVPLPHKRQRQMKIAVLAYARHAAFANVSVCQAPSISPLLPWTDVADSQRHEQALTTHYHILCFCMTVEKRRQAHSNKGYQGLLLPGVLHRSRQLTETPNCTVESHMEKKVQHLNRHSFEMSRRGWLHRRMCMPGQTLYPKPWRTTFSIDDNEGWIGFSEYVSSDPPTGANCWRSKLNLYYPSMP